MLPDNWPKEWHRNRVPLKCHSISTVTGLNVFIRSVVKLFSFLDMLNYKWNLINKAQCVCICVCALTLEMKINVLFHTSTHWSLAQKLNLQCSFPWWHIFHDILLPLWLYPDFCSKTRQSQVSEVPRWVVEKYNVCRKSAVFWIQDKIERDFKN